MKISFLIGTKWLKSQVRRSTEGDRQYFDGADVQLVNFKVNEKNNVIRITQRPSIIQGHVRRKAIFDNLKHNEISEGKKDRGNNEYPT